MSTACGDEGQAFKRVKREPAEHPEAADAVGQIQVRDEVPAAPTLTSGTDVRD